MAKYLAILPWIENIDIEMNPNEGWRFIELYNRLGGEKTRAYDGFSKVSDEVVVLGTGPSLDLAETIDISDKVVIACNTMIKNKELMGRVKPDYLVFADAIYHFGPSTYAAAFRGAFKEFVDSNPQCVVLLPQIFYGFFVEVIGQEYAKNVFSIPEAGHRNVVVDLAQEPSLHRFENILNKMLVPLACTFGRKVYFLGFDGRAKTDKGFWSHSVKNNFVELLPVQEKAHPSFFRKKSYKAYAEHQETVTEMIFAKAEENGNELICLAESNNSAMAKRFDPSLIFEN